MTPQNARPVATPTRQRTFPSRAWMVNIQERQLNAIHREVDQSNCTINQACQDYEGSGADLNVVDEVQRCRDSPRAIIGVVQWR